MIYGTKLENRGILRLKGPDCEHFLQGLLTNDVTRLKEEPALYTLLLTAQGKYLFDLFLIKKGEEWWVEAERSRLEELKKKLSLYKLRSSVMLEIDTNQHIFYLYSDTPRELKELYHQLKDFLKSEECSFFIDPRLPELGIRLIGKELEINAFLKKKDIPLTSEETYQYHRYKWGIPESSSELWIDKSIPLENGMEELNAISWQKGCYMGQELTARTKYRGLVRKRLMPVIIKGKVEENLPITDGEKEVGQWRGHCKDRGLVLLRLEALTKPLKCGEVDIEVIHPSWLQISSLS